MGIKRKAKRGEARKLFEEFAAYRGNECRIWPFNAPTNSRGRKMPQVGLDGRMQCVTRAICERVHGPAPGPNYDAAHDPEICNNPMCCTPAHISWATAKKTAACICTLLVRIASLRGQRANYHANKSIRFYATGTQREIGAQFGVSDMTVSYIKRGKNIYSPAWKSPVTKPKASLKRLPPLIQ